MNTAEGVRRLAQVIRGGSTVLAVVCFLGVLVGGVIDVGWSGLLVALVIGTVSAAVIAAIGHSVAWVLMGFAGDRAPPRGPGD